MLRNVAVIALDHVAPFELGVLCEVFGIDRSDEGLPSFDFAVCSVDGAPVRSSVGFTISPEHALDRTAEADLVAVPACRRPTDPLPEPVLDALRAAVDRGARVLSVCSGVFAVAAAGLLDGRRAAVHWNQAELLASRYPEVTVDASVLYVDDDPVFTSAGTAAGIDLCLYLVRKEYGAEAANGIARRMIVPPHRDGGQAQYIDAPVPREPAESLEGTLTWMQEHLEADHTVESLAEHAYMSPRTFARRFRQETGTTPHHWLTQQRIGLAQRLLEGTDLPVEQVAQRCGLGSAALLRHHFMRHVGTSPAAYRRTFRAVPAAG